MPSQHTHGSLAFLRLFMKQIKNVPFEEHASNHSVKNVAYEPYEYSFLRRGKIHCMCRTVRCFLYIEVKGDGCERLDGGNAAKKKMPTKELEDKR